MYEAEHTCITIVSTLIILRLVKLDETSWMKTIVTLETSVVGLPTTSWVHTSLDLLHL